MPKYAVHTGFLLLIALSGCTKQQQTPFQQGIGSTPGFVHILTDSSLIDWEGDSRYWRFEDSVLTGESTPETILIENTFFIWKAEPVENFEMELEYRISERGNSGINYRSQSIEGKPFVLKGYQADIDAANQFTGQLYEEKGRGTLSPRARVSYISENGNSSEAGRIGSDETLVSHIKPGDWNLYHIYAQGNMVVHSINGQVMTTVVDNRSEAGKKGLLGFQLHLGPPMKVEFRNIRFKKITD